MSIEHSIIKYLATNRRLTIPGLGTFIVKSEGSSNELLFSEFLKDDDKVLRGLLCADGASEIEAVGAIDRLLFEIRHATSSQGGEYPMVGLGVLYRDGFGALAFAADANLVVEPEEVVAPEPEHPVKNNVSKLFEQLNEKQSEREEAEVLFTEEDRRESKRVTQSGRRIYNMMWIVVPVLALLFLVAFVGYVVVEQWRLGLMELPPIVERVLIKLIDIFGF